MLVFSIFVSVSSLTVLDRDASEFVTFTNGSDYFGKQFAYCRRQQFLFVSDPEYVHVSDGIEYYGAIFVYRWIIYEQRFELVTTISLKDTTFRKARNFGTAFSWSTDCRSIFTSFVSGVLMFYQDEYNEFTMQGLEIHNDQVDFGQTVLFDENTQTLVISDPMRIYTCKSTNYDWSVTEQAMCPYGVSNVDVSDGMLYYLCKNESVLHSFDLLTNKQGQSWTVDENSAFTVASGVVIVAWANGMRFISSEDVQVSLDQEEVVSVSFRDSVVAVIGDNWIQFYETDGGMWRDRSSLTPCESEILSAEFVGEGVFMVSCKGERLIKSWQVTNVVSTRQVDNVATAILTLFTVLLLSGGAAYLIGSMICDRQKRRQELSLEGGPRYYRFFG